MGRFNYPKDPAEKVVLTFDFTAELITGETLSGTPTVTVSANGVDSTPSSVLNGAAFFDATNKMVLQPIKDGIADVDYTFRVTSATSNAQKVLTRAGILEMRLAEKV